MRLPWNALAILILGATPGRGQAPPPSSHPVGTVRFTTSCRPAVAARFNHAIALLHSFAFGQADTELRAILADDPGCAMAWWALALSAWGNPFAPGIRGTPQLAKGAAAVEQARHAGQPNDRGGQYIDAVARLYAQADSAPQAERLRRYRDAMATLAHEQPADTEARIFHALAIDIAADPADKSYRSQREAAQILEPLFAVLPAHPGLAHYLIHTYDVPALAAKGIPAARHYAGIAPDVSHALHMPSHVFTRVGMWRESIAANTAAAVRAEQEGSIAEELHAMDYATYAYLQRGLDTAAARLVSTLPALATKLDPALQTTGAPPSAGYYALAAIPARVALERGEWAEATRLPLTPSPVPYAEALTAFARALGGARAGDTMTASSALQDLQRLHDTLANRHESYWADQVDIQRLSASAWLRLTQGDSTGALTLMRSASAREDATEKSVLSPGPLAPAAELLGEMRAALGDPSGALQAFQHSLEHDPVRLRSLIGAVAAARGAGKQELVRNYRRQLRGVCASAGAGSARARALEVACSGDEGS